MRSFQWAPAFGALLLALLEPGFCSPSEEELLLGDDVCSGDENSCGLKLLQRRALQERAVGSGFSELPPEAKVQPLLASPRPRFFGKSRADEMAGRSVYFVVTDRFARTDGETPVCDRDNWWCGGTIKGITAKLDYIKEMEFDTVWITPVVQQFVGETKDGTGCMGYWAKNHYEIDPHFGTPEDLKELVSEMHKRDLKIMMDFVVNHVGPVHDSASVKDLYPFNKVEYIHSLDIGNMSFDDYAKNQGKGLRKLPLQAMWSGSQCTEGESCNCYTCKKLTEADYWSFSRQPAWDKCPYGRMVLKPSSPCPPHSLSAYCMPGDMTCKGYDEEVTLDGWFYDLGDLNQSVPFVRHGLLNWTRWMVSTYDLDMLRLDTAAFVPFDFLNELQEAAGVPIIGEVTATNLSYHAGMQHQGGKPGIDGVLNFPLYYTATAAFCHTFWPQATGNLSFLAERMDAQGEEGLYANVNTLGNFMDNHDNDRLQKNCKGDAARVMNAIAWVMLARGIPIIYYGTEESRILERREALWSHNYTKGRLFTFIQMLNKLRKEFSIGTMPQTTRKYLGDQMMALTRGPNEAGDEVWVYLNNFESGDKVVQYCGNMPPLPRAKHIWVNYLTGQPMIIQYGCIRTSDNLPIILVQRRVAEIDDLPSWDDNFTADRPDPSIAKNPFARGDVYAHR